MVRVTRNQVDHDGKPIQPNERWLRASARQRQKAVEEGAAHQVTTLYKSPQVRTALERLFHDKCAYCESRIGTTSQWDVEHYRPKNRIAEAPEHPGYRWLAYDWDNLFPSCIDCNRRRKDQPRWREAVNQVVRGKHTQFPLKDESRRATKDAELSREKPMLLNPCRDEPSKHLAYDAFGNIVGENGSDRGAATIAVLGLERTRLRDDRRRVIKKVLNRLKEAKGQSKKDRDEIVSSIRAEYTQADDLFVGAVEYVLHYPERFGL